MTRGRCHALCCTRCSCAFYRSHGSLSYRCSRERQVVEHLNLVQKGGTEVLLLLVGEDEVELAEGGLDELRVSLRLGRRRRRVLGSRRLSLRRVDPEWGRRRRRRVGSVDGLLLPQHVQLRLQ